MPKPLPIADYELKTIELTAWDGRVYDLRYMMTELNVFESMWNNQIQCSLAINDAKNMIRNIPLNGGELLNLVFKAPDKGPFIKKFRLHSISDRQLTKEREMVYILNFVTFEAFLNEKKRTSKSYKGKKIMDIVADLHYGELGGGALDIEPTDREVHVIIPDIHPTQAINWLCNRAKSTIWPKGASYLYYQDKDLFRFVTLESRLALGPSAIYIMHTGNVWPDGVQNVKEDETAARHYNFDFHSDMLDNTRTGMYANELLTHSQVRKIWRRYTWDYVDTWLDYSHLYKIMPHHLWPPAADSFGSWKKKDNKLKLHSTGQDDWPFSPEDWIRPRLSQLQQANNIRITLVVPGDSDMTVGKVVEFTLPSPEPLDESNFIVIDRWYRGKWLVTGLRHKLVKDEYVTILELIKDSTYRPYNELESDDFR